MSIKEAEQNYTLQAYLESIAHSKPLSRELEIELVKLAKQGDEAARHRLITANLRFVIRVAKEYQNRGLSLNQLISAGNLGLITAIDRFDEKKGFKLITYAVWWIRQAILQDLKENNLVRLPANKVDLLQEISKAENILSQKGGKDPAIEEIAEELDDVSFEDARDTILAARSMLYFDAPFDEEGGDYSLFNVIPDETQELPDKLVLSLESIRKIDELIESNLDEREIRILRLYYGLDSNDPLTLEQIGGLIGITRERVRQLKERALRKLRSPARTRVR